MKKFGILIVALAWGLVGLAGEKLHFNNLSTGEGLSNKMVLCAAQDTVGFMWFGTAEGLNRYDGYGFRVFRHIPDDTTSISSSWINCIKITRGGQMWIGTEKGVSLYDPVRENFIRYRSNGDRRNLLGAQRIRCIHEEPSGVMWIGTLEGLVRLDPATGQVEQHTFRPGQMDNEVRAICQGGDGTLWIGTFDGLYRFDTASGRYDRFEARERRAYDQSNNLISALWLQDGILYAGTSNGLTVFDTRQERVLRCLRTENSALADNDVKALLPYRPGSLLVATANGISLLDTADGSVQSYNASPLDGTSLPNETVWCAFKDRFGVVWMGTNNGLAKLNTQRKPIDIFPTVTDQGADMRRYMVNGVLTTPDGDVWLTSNYGVMRYDSTLTRLRTYRFGSGGISHSIVKRIVRDSRGTIWIGTNDGINYYDPAADRFRAPADVPQNLSLKYIYTIREDADGDLVVNVPSGICLITPHRRADGSVASLSYRAVPIDRYTSSGNSDVAYLDTDPKGNIWIGTISDGLLRYEKQAERFTLYPFTPGDEGSINSDRIYSIHVDAGGAVWVGTDMGLCRLDVASGRFERFPDDLDLTKSIRGITSDGRHRLWIATLRELIMYDYEFDRKIVCDLQADVDMGETAYNSFFNEPRGKIYLGGYGGLIEFRPSDIVLSLDKAPVVITDLWLSGKRVGPGERVGGREILPLPAPMTRSVRLKHNQTSLRIDFALMNYASPVNNVYSYQLEGYDRTPVTTGNGQNSAAYSNLRPGRYVFHVSGANPDGIWSDAQTVLHITVLPPWWSSWWAWTLYALLALALVRMAWKISMTRLRLSSELKLEKMERQKMEELNRIKMQFFTNVSHEFKTPLSLILGPIESLEQSAVDSRQQGMLAIMRQNAERLLRLINQIMDMRRIDSGKITLDLQRGDLVAFLRRTWEMFAEHAARRGVLYEFNAEMPDANLFFDSDKMEKILYNLISNALKFTPPEGEVSVTVQPVRHAERDFVAVEVSDTGKGIARADLARIFDRFYQGTPAPVDDSYGSGIGLDLTRDFVELHGGEISVISEQGKGSVFRFTVPADLSAPPVPQDAPEAHEEEDPEASDHFAKPSVLVVEDNEDMLMFLKMNMEEFYEVHTATEGGQALALVRELCPDLVLSDVMMPGVDGFELCERIKQDVVTSHIPVVLLTARNDELSRNEGYRRGADGYIYKPFSIKTLRTRIDKMIEQRRKLQENFRLRVLSEPAAIEIQSQDDRFISSLVTVIQEQMEDPDFSIQQLCERTGYSYQQVYRKVKALTGESINEFIRTIRLKRAAQLLADSDLRISEIMYRVGFNSHSYFTKCFRERYGASPKDYAGQKRGKE